MNGQKKIHPCHWGEEGLPSQQEKKNVRMGGKPKVFLKNTRLDSGTVKLWGLHSLHLKLKDQQNKPKLI